MSFARDVDLAWRRVVGTNERSTTKRRRTTDGEGTIGFERAMLGNDGCATTGESRGEG